MDFFLKTCGDDIFSILVAIRIDLKVKQCSELLYIKYIAVALVNNLRSEFIGVPKKKRIYMFSFIGILIFSSCET